MSDPSPQNTRSSLFSLLPQPASAVLKRTRAASAPCESEQARQMKKSRGTLDTVFIDNQIPEQTDDDEGTRSAESSSLKGKGKEKAPSWVHSQDRSDLGSATAAVLEDMFQELKCGCCTELCYNPVQVNPCQHFFCGSCCVLWVRNGGTNCPACRGVSTTVIPSRVIQSMIDLLLRFDSSKARTENERVQADQVYKAGTSLRLPTPRPVTPDPIEPANDNLARPCPTCLPGNAYGWRCPIPIVDPAVDQENAFDLDDGNPPGHAFCGNCDQLHNLQAPTSSKCDFCLVSFCGVGIQGRCCALSLLSQQPQGMSELQDLILNGSIYDFFQKNSVEVDILIDYLRTNDISLRAIYKEIIVHTLQQPRGFIPLIDSGIFEDLHPVSGGDDPDPTAARRRICRLCAAQVLTHGLKDWWLRERKHGNLPTEVMARKDCPQGNTCDKQTDPAHAKEFNHMIHVPGIESTSGLPPAPEPFNVFSPSFHDLPSQGPSHREQDLGSQPSNLAMQLPPISSGNNHSSYIERAFTFMSPASLRSEVEAITNLGRFTEGSSTGGTRSMAAFSPNAPLWARGDTATRSRIFFAGPPPQVVNPAPNVPPLPEMTAEDVLMADVNEEHASRDEILVAQGQEEERRVEPEGNGEQTEQQVPKMSSSPSRVHPIALSPSA